MAKKVVIAGACRTAIGKMGGVLSTVPAVDMGSIVIKEALKRAGVPADQERCSSGFLKRRTSNRNTSSYS